MAKRTLVTQEENMVENYSQTGAAKNVKLIGKHVFGNLYKIKNKKLLTDIDEATKVVVDAMTEGNMHIVDIFKHKFEGAGGNGVSIVALLMESHSTIHTWPEYDYATLDIYSCGDESKPGSAFDYIVKQFMPAKSERFYSDRSLKDD